MASHHVLLAAGSNAQGQLGIGTHDDAHTFAPCQFAGCAPDRLPASVARVADVACGANHTVLLLERADGSTTLWGAGDGRLGQLGVGYDCEASDAPDPAPRHTVFRELDLGAARPSEGYGCTRIAAAWETTYVVLAPSAANAHSDKPGSGSDVLLAMGSDAFGALGVSDHAGGPGARVVPLAHVFQTDNDGDDESGQETRSVVRVRSLHAGPRHVVAELVATRLDADGSSSSLQPHARTVLVGWGASRHGQLGPEHTSGTRHVARPTPLPIDVHADPVAGCALGHQHTVVLHASGRLSALGSNRHGQIPSALSRGRVCGLGCTWHGTYVQAIDGSGEGHVLLATGNNAQGQLGHVWGAGPTSAVDLPVGRTISRFVCGSEHVLVAMSNSARSSDAAVLGWGWNEHGNMGLGSVGNVTVPTQVWPRDDVETYRTHPQRAVGIWAGCATSWLLVE